MAAARQASEEIRTATQPLASSGGALEGAMLQAGMHRLVTRWRTLATRIEPYAAPAARAYEQAAEDLEAEMRTHPERLDALHALRDELLAAIRER